MNFSQVRPVVFKLLHIYMLFSKASFLPYQLELNVKLTLRVSTLIRWDIGPTRPTEVRLSPINFYYPIIMHSLNDLNNNRAGQYWTVKLLWDCQVSYWD